MLIAMITDLHYGARGGNHILQENMSKFIRNIVSPKLDEYGIDDLYVLGDFTDSRKSTDYSIISKIREDFFKPLENKHIYMICGNHDIFYREKNDVASFDVLFGHYDNVTPIIEPTIVNGLFLVPWINVNNEKEVFGMIDSFPLDYCLGHFEVQGAKMYSKSKAEHGLDPVLLDKFKMVFSGHFHHRSKYGNVQYIGAAGYYNWQDYNDFRGMTIFDTDTGRQEIVENPYSAFVELVYDDAIDNARGHFDDTDLSSLDDKYVKLIVEAKIDDSIYNDFVKRLHDNCFDLKIDNRVLLESSTVEEDIHIESKSLIEYIDEYIESIDSDDIKMLKDTVHEIYHEEL